MGEFSYGLAMPKRTFLGRVGRVEKVDGRPTVRTSYEIDAIDIANFTRGDRLAGAPVQAFALLRVVTTPGRFLEMAGVEPEVGDWLLLDVGPRESTPTREPWLPMWQAQLGEAGYTQQSRGYVTGAGFVTSDIDPEPRSLGGKAVQGWEAKRARVISQFPVGAITQPASVVRALSSIAGIARVLVRDVGQASFCSLTDASGDPLVHFDAGWPVSFNGKSVPVRPLSPLGDAPVILSHWDWDHLHGYHRFSCLREKQWITPVQGLGPGAARVADELHRAGLLQGLQASVSLPWGQLERCVGTGDNLNQTGLALRVRLADGRSVLLVGDADYDNAPSLMAAAPYDGLVVTHHGANFDGNVPLSVAPGNKAVISCGRPNTYRHPRKAAIARHTPSWQVERTDSVGRVPRGDRWLP